MGGAVYECGESKLRAGAAVVHLKQSTPVLSERKSNTESYSFSHNDKTAALNRQADAVA